MILIQVVHLGLDEEGEFGTHFCVEDITVEEDDITITEEEEEEEEHKEEEFGEKNKRTFVTM